LRKIGRIEGIVNVQNERIVGYEAVGTYSRSLENGNRNGTGTKQNGQSNPLGIARGLGRFFFVLLLLRASLGHGGDEFGSFLCVLLLCVPVFSLIKKNTKKKIPKKHQEREPQIFSCHSPLLPRHVFP
jgi:hypothetical protein